MVDFQNSVAPSQHEIGFAPGLCRKYRGLNPLGVAAAVVHLEVRAEGDEITVIDDSNALRSI